MTPLTERERWLPLVRDIEQRARTAEAANNREAAGALAAVAAAMVQWLAEPAPSSEEPSTTGTTTSLHPAPSSGGSTAEPVVPRSASVANAPAEQSRGAAATATPPDLKQALLEAYCDYHDDLVYSAYLRIVELERATPNAAGFRAGAEAAARVAVQSALNAEQHPDSVNGYFAAQTARRIEREIAALTPVSAPTLDEGFKAGVEAAAQKVRYASRPEHCEAAGGRVVMYWTVACRDLADMVAALTPAAAADPILPGLRYVQRHMPILGASPKESDEWLEAEISRRAPQGET